jgi:hypothetical protein
MLHLSTRKSCSDNRDQLLLSGKIVEIDGDVAVGMKMKLGDFAQAIATRVWDSVGRANWRAFAEARAFVHGRGLKSVPEWWVYCKSGKKPPDVPTNPHVVYADHGWVSMGDWLGTQRVATHRRRYLPFEDARSYVHGLKLKSQAEWLTYCKSGDKPDNISGNPWKASADEGWVNLGDWLGTGVLATHLREYRPFEDARAYVRELGLKSFAKWLVYCKSGKKPDDMPSNPQNIYLKKGWTSWGDWLGTGRIADRARVLRPFEEARDYARSLGLGSGAEWVAFARSGGLPPDIPAAPWRIYKKKGVWTSMKDWLGTGSVGPGKRQFLPFKRARDHARRLRLKSQAQWKAYRKSGNKPDNIPADPWHVCVGKGWVGLGDWLGTGVTATRARQYRRFDEARAFAHTLAFTRKVVL